MRLILEIKITGFRIVGLIVVIKSRIKDHKIWRRGIMGKNLPAPWFYAIANNKLLP